MKKLFLVLTVIIFGVLKGYADKAIYYPIYITDIEVYHNDSLTKKDVIVNKPTYTLPMYQKGCQITVSTPDITPYIKTSIKQRRSANLALTASILSVSASAINTANALKSHSALTTSLYLTQSYFFLTNAYLDFEIMKRFKELSKGSLVIPVTCNIANTSQKILRGNIIIKPGETQTISNSQYCDEWRFSDNNDNVYCIRMFALVIRDKGFISRELGVAFTLPTGSEKKYHKKEYKRIDLNTYETKWVSYKDEELKFIIKKYRWDNGYNSPKTK